MKRVVILGKLLADSLLSETHVKYQEPLELVYGKSAEDMALEHHDVLTELYIRMAKMSAKQGMLGWVNRGPLGGMICLLGSVALILLLCPSLVWTAFS
jgi:hypothetical protein